MDKTSEATGTDVLSTVDHEEDAHIPLHQTLSPDYAIATKTQSAASHLRRRSPSPAPSAIEVPIPDGPYHPPEDLAASLEPKPAASALRRFWTRNKASMLVAMSQFFGACMTTFARILELEGEGMHPVQVVFFRQSVTAVCCLLYMWYLGNPDFPLGQKSIRPLLMLRGIAGFVGIFGLWYSMMYLSMADATVLTFLAPGVAGIACYYALKEPFTRSELMATGVALIGVVLIARPSVIFSSSPAGDSAATEGTSDGDGTSPGLDHQTTGAERLYAVGIAMIGVCGAAGAFTTIRCIGTRAHPLISVNYFAVMSTVIAVAVLSVAPALNIEQPFLQWALPASGRQWFLLLALGVFGFTLQYLLTLGLSLDQSNRANSMIYTNMLFAAGFDKWVFGHDMDLMSFAGCFLILGSAIGVVITKGNSPEKSEESDRRVNEAGDAESSQMLVGEHSGAERIHLDTWR